MKGTCELRALEPVPGSAHADGGPAGAARTKCRGLSASEANAGAVLIEERAATLTQFLIAGLVLQSGEEADGPLLALLRMARGPSRRSGWPAGHLARSAAGGGPRGIGDAQIRCEGDRMST